MTAAFHRLRSSATAAHVLPMAVFLLFLAVPGWVAVENSELPWYRRAPEHWVYPVQTLVCGFLLLVFRQHYTLRPWRGLGLAVVLGVAGIALWVAPALLREAWLHQGHEEAGWWRWLGMAAREGGFDPGVLAPWPGWQAAAVAMRLLRMVVVVPLVEELLWRGYVMRYAAAQEGDWQKVPFGTHDWRAFFIVTGLVVLAHQPEDYAAALVWGVLMYGLAVRTRSLGACVLMHAVGNALLGVWVLKTGRWGFW